MARIAKTDELAHRRRVTRTLLIRSVSYSVGVPWVLLAGCGASPEDATGVPAGAPTARPDAAALRPNRPSTLFGSSVDWVGPLQFGLDGLSRSLELDPEGSAALSLWIVLDDDCDGRCCVQLTDVQAGDETLVPLADRRSEHRQVCDRCRARVRVAEGDGLFTLPNDGSDLPARPLRLRLQARDCQSFLPLEARFGEPLPEAAWVGVVRHRGPQTSPEVELRVVMAQDALPEDHEAYLREALQVVEQCYQAAGIRFTASARWLEPLGKLSYPSTRALAAAVDAEYGEITVALTPCLQHIDPLTGDRSEPEGTSPRIPGGVPYDVVWVATRSCDLSDALPESGALGPIRPARELGTTLAHELGHYFGLYHSVEVDGTTDHLDDTAGDGFMAALPTSRRDCGLSPRQAAVVRQHVALQR